MLLLLTRAKTQQVILLKLQRHQPARSVKYPEELSRTQDGLKKIGEMVKTQQDKIQYSQVQRITFEL